jgi:HEAT repeat protein
MTRPLAGLFGALVLTFGTHAAAQAVPEKTGDGSPPSLRSRFAVEGLRRPLKAESSVLRQRAFERLGAAGTNAALELLSTALAPGGEARDARERLIAVRALASHVDREIAVDALVRALAGAQTKEDPRDVLVQQTAALALARSHRPRAQQALAQALRQPGRVSETARLGLVAHRPSSIAPLLEAAGTPTAALVQLLGELGDPRAASLLASLAKSGPVELRAEALLSLARLDAPHALALSRGIAASEPGSPLGAAAARLLVSSGDPSGPAVFAAHLREPVQRRGAYQLALEVKQPELADALLKAAPDPDDFELWLAALGRSGGGSALARLEQLLADPARGWAAAYALSRAGDSDADRVLERALERPATRRDAARAATLRRLTVGRSVSGLAAALDALERSPKAADRAAAAFARAALEPEDNASLVSARDPVVVRAVARAASSGALARAAALRLAREPDPNLRASLASALADPLAADLVPDRVLFELLEGRGAGAHLAARALAARDDEKARPRLRELLASSDAALRAHVALGLARSKSASVIGMLAEAYRFETEPRVRRAIVLALAARREKGRRIALRLAADLDPDQETRDHARRALGSGRSAASSGAEAIWLRLDEPDPSAPSTFAVFETASGLMLPAAPDPDGSVLYWPLPHGEVRVILASPVPGARSPAT